MANWQTAFDWMMDNEDALRAYAIVNDVGGQAISGINSAVFPDNFAAISSVPQVQRGILVQAFYYNYFWNQWYAQLNSDDVAKRVFDAAVNMGPGTAVKLLQQAIDNCAKAFVVSNDGIWGQLTVGHANICPPDRLVAAFQQARSDHYRAIVAADASKAPYLATWLARSEK
jgi:lysozyme family protein